MHFILEGPGIPVVTEVGLPGKGGGEGGWKISKFQRVTRFMWENKDLCPRGA